MSAQFTPGPWGLTDRGDLFRIREEASDAVIATTDNGGHPVDEIFDWDTQRANANLIAAAPELYTALEAMVHWCIKRGPFDEPLGESEQEPEVNLARAALAKARGEQS